MRKRETGLHWCCHCEKETTYKVVWYSLYNVPMSHRECIVCGYSVEFSYPPEAVKEEQG